MPYIFFLYVSTNIKLLNKFSNADEKLKILEYAKERYQYHIVRTHICLAWSTNLKIKNIKTNIPFLPQKQCDWG